MFRVKLLSLYFSLMVTLCGSSAVLHADEGDDLYNLSLGLIRQERFEAATETLEKLVKQFPRHPKTEIGRFRLGLIYLTLENYESSRKHLRDFAANNKDSKNLPEALYRIGFCSFQLQDMPATEKELAIFHQQNPKHRYREWSLAYLGFAHLQTGKAQAALSSFEQSLQEYPKGAMREDSVYGQARAFEELKQVDKAIESYRQLAEDPTGRRNDQALMKLGGLLYEQKKYADAAQEYARLAKEFPKSSQAGSARMNAGYAYYQAQQYQPAREQFRAAAEAGIQRPMALYWQGLSEKALQNYQEASKTFQASAEIIGERPASAPIRFQWADAEFQIGQYEQAREQFLQSHRVDPKSETADDALYLAAESSLMLDELETANQLLDQLKQEYPESGLADYRKLLQGRIAAKGGTAESLKQADSIFQQLLENPNPSLARLSRFHLARSLEKQDRCPEALSALNPLFEQLSQDSSSDLIDAYLIKAECHRRLAVARHLEARPLRKQLNVVNKASDEGANTELREKIQELTQASTSDARESLASIQAYLRLKPGRGEFADVLQIQSSCAALTSDQTLANSALEKLAQGAADPAVSARVLFEVAEIAYDLGNFDWSAQLYTKLSSQSPGETWEAIAFSGLGWSRFEAEEYAAAAEAFGHITEKRPRHELAPEAAFMQGESLRQSGQLSEAQIQFAKTFSTYAPNEPSSDADNSAYTFARRAGLESARLLKEQEKIAEADAAYQTVLERFPEQPGMDRLMSEWAVLNANAGRFERSDQIFQKLLQLNPDSQYADNARLSLAESALESGKLSDARSQLTALVQSDKTNDDLRKRAMSHLIRLEITSGEWDAIARWTEEFEKRYPQDEFRNEANFYRAEALLNRGKPKEAGDILNELYQNRNQPAVKEAAWSPRLWVLMGEVAVQRKQYTRVDELVAEMNGWEATKPFRYQMQEIMGRARKNQARFAEAIAAFESVTKDEFGEKTPTAAKSQFLIGETLLLQKKYKDALEAYLKVYVLYKHPEWQAPALYQAGLCDEALEQWQKALTSYEDLRRDFPNSEFATRAQARINEVKTKVK